MSKPEGDDGPSYGTLLGRLMRDGERFAKARLQLYRALFYFRLSQARMPVAALAGAMALGTGAVVAFAIGLVLALLPLVGPLFAGLLVTAGLGASAALLARYAMETMPDMSELPFEDDDLIDYERDPVPEQLLTPEERARIEP